MPITARTLECLIRLSTAIARSRLGSEITRDDAQQAVELLRFALFAEEAEIDDEDFTFEKCMCMWQSRARFLFSAIRVGVGDRLHLGGLWKGGVV